MFAPILVMLLVSGPPKPDSDAAAARLIVDQFVTALSEQKKSGCDITICVRHRRAVSISGRLESTNTLSVLLETVKPHADTLTLRIGIGCEPPAVPDPAESALQRHHVTDWTDGGWQQKLKVRPAVTSAGE